MTERKVPKYKIKQVVFVINCKYIPDRKPCPACNNPGQGRIKLLDGNWYDCPRCNLIETDYEGFDIRKPENAGWEILNTGKNVYTIKKRAIVNIIFPRSCRGKIMYILDDSLDYTEDEVFNSKTKAREHIENLKEEEN